MSCTIAPNHLAEIDRTVGVIANNRIRYELVAKMIECPWYLVGILHSLECNFSFDKHLHNGDPLVTPTVHVPPHRPWVNKPWNWNWTASAVDALKITHNDAWKDWSIAGMLYRLESYNGLAYRMYHPECLSPYLWSMTNHYTKGKYVADGHYDPNAVSQQCGAATILKRGITLGVFVE